MNKKLVKIEHVRCGETEWGQYTYLIAPADKTQEQFEKDVDIASDNYLAAKEKFKQLNSKPKYRTSHLDQFDENLTIKEAKQIIKQEEYERDLWSKKEKEYSGDFSYYMQQLGYSYLSDFDEDEIMTTSVNWGHRHGEHIDYGITKTDTFEGIDKKEEKDTGMEDVLWDLYDNK